MRILKYLKSLIIKVLKPNINSDSLLQTIDVAPYYQAIPESIFDNERRARYLKWRNRNIRRNSVERNKLLDLKGKDVLDIGCNIGYIGWSNASMFNNYTGIDYDQSCVNAAESIVEELGFKNLQFETMDFIKFVDENKKLYDVCLFFSIYHHLLYQVGFEKARNLLNKLSSFCNEMYFDMGQKNEPCNPARFKWHSILPDEEPERFIKREVIENTLFNTAIVVGETVVGNSKRLLFKITK